MAYKLSLRSQRNLFRLFRQKGLCLRAFTTTNNQAEGDTQDDFFASIPETEDKTIKKIENKSIENMTYDGQIQDRQTEDKYETQNIMTYDQKFSDKVRVYVNGGNGGAGCVSFLRENYGSRIPDGGSGGDGGDVYFRSTGRLSNLYDLRRAHFLGNNGKCGMGKKRGGTIGKDMYYSVPLGTEIFEIKKSNKSSQVISIDKEFQIKVADLDQEGQSIRLARGGAGAQGNFERKDLQQRLIGEEGERKEFELRLKMIADVGFIGFPNAGKSTLLAAITRAFPKIGHYPFTTLRPYIGYAKFVDESQILFADLPGIIEGAHQNKGLGIEFLQHAERTKALLYIIDGSVEEEDRSPLQDYEVLRNELKHYRGGLLLDKPSLIIVNKCDRKYVKFTEKLEKLKRVAHSPVIPISAKEGQNLEIMLEAVKSLLHVS